MSKYAGTKTEKNLMEAFAGESQARNKYTYFASVAKKAGFEQIAALFLETADQEKEHAKMWFKEFHGLGDTAQNLIWAAEGENDEWTNMYARMAEEADEEGFPAIATAWRKISEVEAFHEQRYRKLLSRVEAGQVFEREEEIEWQCRNCGYVHKGKSAPKACPACVHPQEYFEPRRDNY